MIVRASRKRRWRTRVRRVADRLGQQPVFVDTSSSDDTSRVSEIIPGPIRDRALQPATTSLKLSKVRMRSCVRCRAFVRWVDVVEMLEAGRIFELAEQRQAVPPVAFRGAFRSTLGRWPGQAETAKNRGQCCKGAGRDDGSTVGAREPPEGNKARFARAAGLCRFWMTWQGNAILRGSHHFTGR